MVDSKSLINLIKIEGICRSVVLMDIANVCEVIFLTVREFLFGFSPSELLQAALLDDCPTFLRTAGGYAHRNA